MEKFADRYKKVAGEWNDEAGTKVYALEIILATLKKAGPEAIANVELFKKSMPDFSHEKSVHQRGEAAQICWNGLLQSAAPDRCSDGRE